MAAADRATIADGRFSGIALMQAAGAAVVDIALKRFGATEVVHVLCGPGNNGGDGYVAARLLVDRGVDVRLHALADPKPGTDAAIAAGLWQGEAAPLDDFAPGTGDLVIDALFGAGFTGALPAIGASALQRAVETGCPVLAVDLPSGVNGDTGQAADAVACAATVTFYRCKPGHLLEPGRSLCGSVSVADIGVRATEPASVFANAPDLWRDALPRPAADTHKYARGAVAVFSGPRHSTGASRLAALAAQRVGAGAVTILAEAAALDIHAVHVTSIMLRRIDANPLNAIGALKGLGSIVLGPGFADLPRIRALAPAILRDTEAGLVLDADGITAFQGDPSPLFDLARQSGSTRLVLTPHEGEFARLFPGLAANNGLGKLQKASKAAEESGAVVLYKGSDTVIAAPDGRAVINHNGTAALATAGSGDVLAGVIAGLTAQSVPIFEAACSAAFLHGRAGRSRGQLAIAEDLVPEVANALQSLLDTIR